MFDRQPINRSKLIRSGVCHFRTEDIATKLKGNCLKGDYLIVGLSTGADLYGVLSKTYPEQRFAQITTQGCSPGEGKAAHCQNAFNLNKRNIGVICARKGILIASVKKNPRSIQPLVKLLKRECSTDIFVFGRWNKLDKGLLDIVFHHQDDAEIFC